MGFDAIPSPHSRLATTTNKLEHEPNPFEQSFSTPTQGNGQSKPTLPPISHLDSPAILSDFYFVGQSLRSGPLSPSMLTAPQTTSQSTGLKRTNTPNLSVAGFNLAEPSSPMTAALLNAVPSGIIATPGGSIKSLLSMSNSRTDISNLSLPTTRSTTNESLRSTSLATVSMAPEPMESGQSFDQVTAARGEEGRNIPDVASTTAVQANAVGLVPPALPSATTTTTTNNNLYLLTEAGRELSKHYRPAPSGPLPPSSHMTMDGNGQSLSMLGSAPVHSHHSHPSYHPVSGNLSAPTVAPAAVPTNSIDPLATTLHDVSLHSNSSRGNGSNDDVMNSTITSGMLRSPTTNTANRPHPPPPSSQQYNTVPTRIDPTGQSPKRKTSMTMDTSSSNKKRGTQENQEVGGRVDKRQNFLERNRIAALKCRQRKKQWINELQNTVDVYSSENEKLEREVQQLRQEVLSLKALMLGHKECPLLQANGMLGLDSFDSAHHAVPRS
ncbi:Transcription factor [Dispira parvispora]|uniref:Transcription factor n=1 Tax=Dispira parvispora TaxID=1520584 RepID=A0A9W8AK55_9FUNG|nr:Transcription factor [Dispira parvispora]